MKKPDGGPVFGIDAEDNHGYPITGQLTLSLRDWFAGMALIGFRISNPSMSAAEVSTWSYRDADAMIAERKRTPYPIARRRR